MNMTADSSGKAEMVSVAPAVCGAEAFCGALRFDSSGFMSTVQRVPFAWSPPPVLGAVPLSTPRKDAAIRCDQTTPSMPETVLPSCMNLPNSR